MNKALFNRWIKASCEECLDLSGDDVIIFNNKMYFENSWNVNLNKNKQFYDPQFNFNSEFLEGIDFLPEHLWYLYRPCSNYTSNYNGWKLYHEYKFKIFYEGKEFSKKHIEMKEKYILKRYYNCLVETIKVFYLKNKPDVKVYHGSNVKIEYIKCKKNINQSLFENSSYSDLIVLYLEEYSSSDTDEIILDNFIPAYPIWLDEKVIVLTPILLQQLNGCDNENKIQSLYNRIYEKLGGALIINDNLYLPNKTEEDIQNGMNLYDELLLQDGRVKKLIPEYTKHIPKYGHGWTVCDSTPILAAAVKLIKPKVVFELGSMSGLSARTISRHNPQKDFKLYALDFFKPAISNPKFASSKVESVHKLLYNHHRYETYSSNVGGWQSEAAEPIDNTSRYFFDKPDTNTEKEVFLLKMDIKESLELLYKNRIVPDLIFIHYWTVGNSAPLGPLLEKLQSRYPNVTIVGSNYIYPAVQRIINGLDIDFIKTYNETYTITPDEITFKKLEREVESTLKKIGPTKFQKELKENIQVSIFEPYDKSILNNAFLKMEIQSSTLINQYIKDNRVNNNGRELIKDIYENPNKVLWEYPMHGPPSYTFFDYFMDKIEYE